jgi:preprotein translocase subunit SecF
MFSFVKYRKYAALFSLSIMVAALGLYCYRLNTRGYGFIYSVEFTGGTQVLLKFNKNMSDAQLKDSLEKAGFEGVMIRDFGNNEILVRVKDFSGNPEGVGQEMVKTITNAAPDYEVTVLQNEAVGPGVGSELRSNAIKAVILALIAMLAYVAFRFWSFAFAAGAVVALLHDALIMIAVFLLFDREISTNFIAAILAILGYSINDTIVIFAQIRHNIKDAHHAPLAEIVDISLNQTLRRTILTSVATAIAVGSMLILGGEALRDFSLALLVGIVFGTYSSIYIASPVMMALYRKN